MVGIIILCRNLYSRFKNSVVYFISNSSCSLPLLATSHIIAQYAALHKGPCTIRDWGGENVLFSGEFPEALVELVPSGLVNVEIARRKSREEGVLQEEWKGSVF